MWFQADLSVPLVELVPEASSVRPVGSRVEVLDENLLRIGGIARLFEALRVLDWRDLESWVYEFPKSAVGGGD